MRLTQHETRLYWRGVRLGLLLGIAVGLAAALIDVHLMMELAEWMR
jgi:hypothetical protein